LLSNQEENVSVKPKFKTWNFSKSLLNAKAIFFK
jgi:hypothetical protein